MTDDEKMFPEEGFPEGGTEAPAPEETPLEQAPESYTPWLNFVEKYPKYMAEEIPKSVIDAVEKGENPIEEYLRLENERLERDLQLMRAEQLLRRSSTGKAGSTKGETPSDDFAEGLLY